MALARHTEIKVFYLYDKTFVKALADNLNKQSLFLFLCSWDFAPAVTESLNPTSYYYDFLFFFFLPLLNFVLYKRTNNTNCTNCTDVTAK